MQTFFLRAEEQIPVFVEGVPIVRCETIDAETPDEALSKWAEGKEIVKLLPQERFDESKLSVRLFSVQSSASGWEWFVEVWGAKLE